MVNLAGVRVPSTSKRQMVFGCSLSAKDILTVVVGVVGRCFVAVSLAKETSPFCCYLLRVHNKNGKRRQYRRTCENAKKFTASQRDASLRAQIADSTWKDGSVFNAIEYRGIHGG